MKQARDAAIELAETIEENTAFDETIILGKAVARSEKWKFIGTPNDTDDKCIHKEWKDFSMKRKGKSGYLRLVLWPILPDTRRAK